jgi:arsenite methyltransferase
MTKLQVYDPPMCCSTGICGPNPDPVLPRFAADLHWLASIGVDVERYNLAQQPQAFVANPVVKAALTEHGNECLPLVLVDGVAVSRGSYPARGALARFAGVQHADVRQGLPMLQTSSCAPDDASPSGSSGGCCA